MKYAMASINYLLRKNKYPEKLIGDDDLSILPLYVSGLMRPEKLRIVVSMMYLLQYKQDHLFRSRRLSLSTLSTVKHIIRGAALDLWLH